MKNGKGDRETGRRGAKNSSRPVAPSPHLRVSPSRPLITLLTDFGTADYFVGAMKGVILSLSPQARVVDLTHHIPPQDIASAAFTLAAVYQSFPAGTIHVAVVDPGVGSSRRPILTVADTQFFVGPDNGIFSYIFDRVPDAQVFQLTSEQYFQYPLSATFHGRDIFAPVAAALANGVQPAKLGKRINDPVSLPSLAPERLAQGGLRGRILHIDHFGNCVTNITQEELLAGGLDSGFRLTVKQKVIQKLRRNFSGDSEGDKPDELFTIWGSAGFLEIAAMNRSAAEILQARRGEAVVVSALGKTKK